MPNSFEQVIVVLSEDTFAALGLTDLDESRWMPSEHRGYSLRVDPARAEMHQQRHVHIARDKHVAAKHKQVAWNADGSRHDRKSFNSAFQSMAVAKDIARRALGLPSDSLLEAASPDDHVLLVADGLLNESLDPAADLSNTLCLVLRD